MSRQRTLLFSMELSNKIWRLCFTDGAKMRQKCIGARDTGALLQEIGRAKEKFALPASCGVISCYEAGRDGFWIHRFLAKNGIENRVLDPASIEVNRRSKQQKTDRLDASKLTRLLLRAERFAEKKAFSVVRVPGEEEEAAMRTYRERERLVKEIKGHVCRIKSLLNLQGLECNDPGKCRFAFLVDWQGRALCPPLIRELQREQQRLCLAKEQLAEIEHYQWQHLKKPQSRAEQQGKQLAQLRGVGLQSSWALGHEYFGWREFKNRRQVGACAGLVGTPYDSGDSRKEQGISKAGNRRIRYLMIELAWGWLRYQPGSALSQWYQERFGFGNRRLRRIGIVALARKLLVALWKFVQYGQLPEGAQLGGAI